MSRPSHRSEPELVALLALIPTTRRKALRIARVRQDGIELIELRSANLDPDWQPTIKDHRTTIRTSAIGRVIAALEAAEAKIGGAS